MIANKRYAGTCRCTQGWEGGGPKGLLDEYKFYYCLRDLSANTGIFGYNVSFQPSKSNFIGIEDALAVHVVERQANPSPNPPGPPAVLSVVTSTRKRGRHTAPVDNDLVCNDLGCETLVSDDDLLRCDSPGCYLVVSPV